MRQRSTVSHFADRRLRFGLILGTLALVVAIGVVWQQGVQARPTLPTATDRQITRWVALLMQKSHISGQKIDDEHARRCMTAFLKNLDPMKVYFYQSDADEFVAERDKIDDSIKRGDIRIAHDIFDRFLTRVNERVAQIEQVLAMEHDYTIDEEMIRDADATVYPKTPEEALERWRKRIKFDLMSQMADDVEKDEAIEKLRRRYTNFAKRMEKTDNDELLEIYLTSLTMGFDPHSSYMSPSTLENFFIQISLQLEGIGASLTVEDGHTVIKKIIPGGAADRDGRLKVEDKIVGVGEGTDGEIVDVIDMKLNNVVKKIRGKAGTIVRLQVLSDGDGGRQIYDITRAKIELRDSEARSRIISGNAITMARADGERQPKQPLPETGRTEDGKPEPESNVVPAGLKPDGTPYRIGVIDLPSFYMDMEGAQRGAQNYKRTSADVRRLLEQFNKEKVDAVIVDLRQNGGGSLTEAVETTGLFIDEGPVVQVKGPDGRIQPYNDRDAGMTWDGPLVVLTSKFSASASEIFAGAIHDYERGIVIGDKSTHGKGTVQQLFDIGRTLFRIPNPPKLGALKLTIQQFYLPDGDSTQNRGVVSDVELPRITSHLDIGESDLDYALDFDSVEALHHDHFNLVSDEMLAKLRMYSEARWQVSDDFAKELKKIATYNKQKQRSTRTLNREKYLAERAELDTDKEEKEQLEDVLNGEDEIFDAADYYNGEVLAITLDYLRLLHDNAAPMTHLAD